jgi:hypothetical protein
LGRPNCAGSEDVTRAPRAFHERRLILAPRAAASLLPRRGGGGCHHRSWVMAWHHRLSLEVRRRRLPASGVLLPLALPSRKCRRLSRASGPRGRHHSPAPRPRHRPPSGSGSRRHRASKSGNRPRLQIEEPPPLQPRGPPLPRALGKLPLSHALGGLYRSCIAVGRKKLSPSALVLIL